MFGDGLHERLPRGEVAIDRSDAHARGAGDLRHLDLVPALGEERGRGLEHASSITSGISAQAAGWIRHEVEAFGRRKWIPIRQRTPWSRSGYLIDTRRATGERAPGIDSGRGLCDGR